MDFETDENTTAADCERTRELVHLHVGGDLEPAEERALDAHLEHCEGCRGVAAEADRLRQVYFEAAAVHGSARADGVDLWPDIRRALVAEGRLAVSAGAPPADGAVPAALPEAVEPVDAGRPSPGGAIYRGRFGAATLASAAALLALVGAQFLFGPGAGSLGGSESMGDAGESMGDTGARGGVASMDGAVPVAVRQGGLADARGSAQVVAPMNVGLTGDAQQPASGLRPIGVDERLIQSGQGATVLAPVRGFPMHLVPSGAESLASSYR